MKWVIGLSVITIFLTVTDTVVHLVEATTTADVIGRVAPGHSGITDLRQSFGRQAAWTLASGSVVLAQVVIIAMASRFIDEKGRPQVETNGHESMGFIRRSKSRSASKSKSFHGKGLES